MKIIKPIDISPAMVTSDVVETHPTWSAAVTYHKTDRVVYAFKVYESLINTNLNKDPTTNPTEWLVIGPSNTVAMFDTSYSTQTVGQSSILVSIQGSEIVNSIAVLNITAPASVLHIRLYDSNDALVYTRTSNLDDSVVTDWYDYFFNPFEQLESTVHTDLPPYNDYRLELELIGSGEVKIGAVILGNYQIIGLTQYGISFGIKDYSLKEENAYGDVVFTKRNNARRIEPTVEIRNTDIRKVTKFLTSILSTPTVFIPTDIEKYDALITYGFLADWTADIVYEEHSSLRLDIKGLT